MTLNIEKKIVLLLIATTTMTVLMTAPTNSVLAAPGDPGAKARAIQNGVSLDTDTQGQLGLDIDCVGAIDDGSDASYAICYLVPEGVPTPNYNTDPSVISQIASPIDPCPSATPDPGFQPTDDCFITTFGSANFANGQDWRFVVEFYNSDDELVGLAGIDYRVHTFFVLPDSAIGAIAIVGASLAAYGGYTMLRTPKSMKN